MKFNLSKIDFSLLKVPDLDLEEFNNVIQKYLGKESAEFLKKAGKFILRKRIVENLQSLLKELDNLFKNMLDQY